MGVARCDPASPTAGATGRDALVRWAGDRLAIQFREHLRSAGARCGHAAPAAAVHAAGHAPSAPGRPPDSERTALRPTSGHVPRPLGPHTGRGGRGRTPTTDTII